MAEQVWREPDIYRINVPLPQNPLKNLNVYVIRTEERNLVIDTGFRRPECREALWQGLEELDLDLSRTALFLTHLHSDHTGLVWDFVDRGVPVYMGRLDLDTFHPERRVDHLRLLEDIVGREGFPPEEMAKQATGNQGRAFAPRPGFPGIPLDDGDCLPLGKLEARVLHTPGHTPGHMVLYLPEHQLLFSGDHILFDITPNISIWYGVPHSLSDYLHSLERFRVLPVRAAFPAHRSHEGDVHQRAAEIQAHHARRLEEILAAVKDRPGSTAYDIAGKITWSARGRKWEDFPPHQRWFAMTETLAHLYYLTDMEKVERRQEDERFLYYHSGSGRAEKR